jgi:hypothetical protein
MHIVGLLLIVLTLVRIDQIEVKSPTHAVRSQKFPETRCTLKVS